MTRTPPAPDVRRRLRLALTWIGLLLLWAGWQNAQGTPFARADEAAKDVKSLGKVAGELVGALVTLAAGGKAAWKAYRDEDWVGYGITAVVAAALAFIAGSMF